MRATNPTARLNVTQVVEWLGEEFDFEGDDLPLGITAEPHSCPIACAIKTATGHKRVSVGAGYIIVGGVLRFGVGLGKDVPKVPDFVIEFIQRFDRHATGYGNYYGYGC